MSLPSYRSNDIHHPDDVPHPSSGSPRPDSQASRATHTPHTLTLALTTWNLLCHDYRHPNRPQKRNISYMETWNLQVILSLWPKILGWHPDIKIPHPKQLDIKKMENLNADIAYFETRLKALMEAQRVLGVKGICQFGEVDNLAFLGALNLSRLQRETEIGILKEQIKVLNREFDEVAVGVFGAHEDDDYAETGTALGKMYNDKDGRDVAGEFGERPVPLIHLDSGIGNVRRSLEDMDEGEHRRMSV